MSSDNVPINSLKICVIAGEASGDLIGGSLISALKKLSNVPIVFTGIGGEKMREEGLNSLFPINDLSIMGIFELLPHIPKLLRRINETVAHINLEKPDAVVTIDSPGFALRVANKVKNSHTRLIHYVAPSVWAWKAWRAREMSKSLDRVLTLFHFEPAYFEVVGLDSKFVGHPVLESGAAKGNGNRFRSINRIAPHEKLICVLPGSRLVEVTKLLPVMQGTLTLLEKEIGEFQLVMPLTDNVERYIKDTVRRWPYKINFTKGVGETKYDAFAASDVALACSGTVALELALATVPYITIYKMTLISNILARIFVNIKHVNIVNILLNENVVPELLLGKCKPHLIFPELLRALNDAEFKSNQRKKFKLALDLLIADGQLPSERAAHAVLEIMPKNVKSFIHNTS